MNHENYGHGQGDYSWSTSKTRIDERTSGLASQELDNDTIEDDVRGPEECDPTKTQELRDVLDMITVLERQTERVLVQMKMQQSVIRCLKDVVELSMK
ncbi:hypothetical protein NMY22_g11786 [Coprinellus aureogranulatus]|nr:hypothetical protein NMY22_g11786 [Coprinellus aureogranulatus]